MKPIAYGLAALLISAPAYAQQANQTPAARGTPTDSACLVEFREAVAQIPANLSREERIDLRRLRDAMVVFAERGNEQACRLVAVEIERIIQQAPTAATTDAGRAERIGGAQAMTQRGAIEVGQFIDSDLMTQNDEEVGEITDVIVVPGQQMRIYLMVDRDEGWLDTTEDLVPVPLHAVRITEDDEVVIQMTEEEFDQVPAIDDDAMADAGMYNDIDQRWQR